MMKTNDDDVGDDDEGYDDDEDDENKQLKQQQQRCRYVLMSEHQIKHAFKSRVSCKHIKKTRNTKLLVL